MNLETYAVFVEVARLGSFSKAAQSLKLSTTATSAKIKKLEETLAVRLFERTTRAVALTEVGEKIFEKAEALIQLNGEIHDIAAYQMDEPQGLLRISAMPTIGSLFLGDWLIEFQQQYPKVEFEMIYSNAALDLHEHRLDFGFRQHSLPDSNLIARTLTSHQWGVFANPAFLARQPPIEHPEDLHKVPCIGVLGESIDSIWRFKKGSRELQFHPKTVLSVEDPMIGARAASGGIGVAYLVKSMIGEHLQNGDLVQILPDWECPLSELYLIYPSKDYLPAKSRAFIDFVLEKFSIGVEI